MGDALTWTSTLALAVALAACAGLRAWLPLFVAGLLARVGVAEVGDAFGWLASTPALVLFGIATIVEIVADKVPALDHALDTISTFIRPVAGAIVAAAVLVRIEDPLIAVVVGMLVGAPVALAPHAAKASARVVSSGTTAGLANPVISTIEDVLAIVIAVLAFVVPVLLVIAMLTFAIVFVRWIRRRSQRAGQARA
ncbi:DUF4126 domain-containing protein [Sandaracinus amylolyticus]|nr:DUF4126 domain-containing protein [Sandaracinus amylolyticus]